MKLYTLLPISRYIKPGIQTIPLDKPVSINEDEAMLGNFGHLRIITDYVKIDKGSINKNYINGLLHSASSEALTDNNMLYDTVSLYHKYAKENKKSVIYEDIAIFISYEEGDEWLVYTNNDTISHAVSVLDGKNKKGIIIVIKPTDVYQPIEFSLRNESKNRIRNYCYSYSMGRLTI